MLFRLLTVLHNTVQGLALLISKPAHTLIVHFRSKVRKAVLIISDIHYLLLFSSRFHMTMICLNDQYLTPEINVLKAVWEECFQKHNVLTQLWAHCVYRWELVWVKLFTTNFPTMPVKKYSIWGLNGLNKLGCNSIGHCSVGISSYFTVDVIWLSIVCFLLVINHATKTGQY